MISIVTLVKQFQLKGIIGSSTKMISVGVLFITGSLLFQTLLSFVGDQTIDPILEPILDLISILGIVFGIPVGLGLASMILDNILRLFYFEINVLPFTWVILWTIVILIVLLSQLPAFYRGIKLELPTIIKELSI